MTRELKLSPQDRVLVLAPHPDDETLAAGDLIQAALAAGSALRVVFATDGDNNPWPQRWLERRWRIGPRARARWGARRRGEALAALAALGVRDVEREARFLGWPDQGLTALLMRDDAAVAVLANEFARFAPTHLVMPILADRHPDHSALRVLADLAALRAGSPAQRLGYIVHGEKPQDAGRLLTVASRDASAKQRAMEHHASQLALSRKRLLGLAALPNRFEPVDRIPLPPGPPRLLRLTSRSPLRRCDLLLVIALPEEPVRLRVALPRGAGVREAVDGRGRRYSIECGARALAVSLPEFETPPVAIYAKLHRRDPRLLIFDREHWRHDAELLRAPAAALTGSAESGYI
ncbi:PIG-L family deacetylase [Dokdonella sp.]|uniref:PIG-L deacetylase family protein n=1 Tax=Dokdonella sp. TaxID=2291710 RepID=UPI001B0A9890|nr:PIG-L family deacetylase [Dokdonella sp.]MBO9662737.1 PIG-L family deacetylase [Dokdonella sp.]